MSSWGCLRGLVGSRIDCDGSYFRSVVLRCGRIVTTLVVVCGPSSALSDSVKLVDQGEGWTEARRQQFYMQDQGSRMMPLSWIKALKQPDGTGFMADVLSRYGYLPKPESARPDLPVGFTVADEKGVPTIGMTCAACHTRQIEVSGNAYRIDGGPAIVDFQGFLADLDRAVGAVLATPGALATFASEVLGASHTPAEAATLLSELETWYLRYHTLMERALPTEEWGPSRLDAVSMIFNRLAGLDIGLPPAYLIPDNIFPADAPTRYPFLWNAARQDKTQWPGFADNGNNILGLARNLGEVYGVFAAFHPQKSGSILSLNVDYLATNSANFGGLETLESLIWKIGPPKWSWELDESLVAEGAAIYARSTAEGGCADCHGIRKGAFRGPFHSTWATPIQDVGTDTRECRILTRVVETGVLEGARIPIVAAPLKAEDTVFNVLRMAVLGAIIQNTLRIRATSALETAAADEALPFEIEYLKGAFRSAPLKPLAESADVEPGCAYEARVLQGIWAAAPYLHNASVPSLGELLKPASERVSEFRIGPNYDLEAVGLAADQAQFDYTLKTTDCAERDSGNSRCGHEYGTTLPADERKALLEYLKSL